MNPKCAVSIDYLTFSVKVENPDEVIKGWLGMDLGLFEAVPYSFNGYLQSKRFSGICVCYNGYEDDLLGQETASSGKESSKLKELFSDMGVCVSMSGEGCRAFERYSSLGFRKLFEKLAENIVIKVKRDTGEYQGRDAKRSFCNVSRIDVACDDRAGLLDMSLMSSKLMDTREVRSRMRTATDYRKNRGADYAGHSMYVGSEKSSFRLRIYDKALEQAEKMIEETEAKAEQAEKADVSGHWVRVEMVMRYDNAVGFLLQAVAADSIGKLAAQVLNDKFAFIERDDSNISRCSVCEWWASFVAEVKSVTIWTRIVVRSSLDRIVKWLSTQISSSMATIGATYGIDFLQHIAWSGMGRLSKRQQALIRDYSAGDAVSQIEIDRCSRVTEVDHMVAEIRFRGLETSGSYEDYEKYLSYEASLDKRFEQVWEAYEAERLASPAFMSGMAFVNGDKGRNKGNEAELAEVEAVFAPFVACA